MKKFVSLVAALGAFACAPAYAQAFNGFYVGAEIGYDQYEAKSGNLAGTGIVADGISANGIAGGIYAGYDFAFTDSLFAGLEAAFLLSGADVTVSDAVDTVSVKAKESYNVSARLGVMLNDSTGLYARLGWENTRFKGVVNLTSDSERADGFVYGAGVETRIGTNVALRLEYDFVDYGNNVFGGGIGITDGRVRAGVAYRF